MKIVQENQFNTLIFMKCLNNHTNSYIFACVLKLHFYFVGCVVCVRLCMLSLPFDAFRINVLSLSFHAFRMSRLPWGSTRNCGLQTADRGSKI